MKIKSAPFCLVVMLELIISTACFAQTSPRCEAEVAALSLSLDIKGTLRANGVGVVIYSPEQALTTLDISPTLLDLWRSRGAKIVTVGEGYSGLLPFLLKRGLNCVGLDIWYNKNVEFPNTTTGQAMRNFVNAHSDHLVQGNARHMPFVAESVDVLLSHKLVNNLQMADILDFVTDALRVLKIGGEARIQGFYDSRMYSDVADFLAANFDRSEYRIETKDDLLRITKLSRIAFPRVIKNSFGGTIDGARDW